MFMFYHEDLQQAYVLFSINNYLQVEKVKKNRVLHKHLILILLNPLKIFSFNYYNKC